MTPKDPRFIRRREFLISTATLAGAGLPAIGWAATKPCPPPTLSVTGGSSTTSSCASTGGLPVLTLTSAAASGTYPWTFGQAFRQGDVPNGAQITGDSSSFQAEVRNRWSDGSVKFAVLSGVSAFSQNQPKVVSLAAISSAPSGANVAEPTSLDVSVAFTGGVSGTYTLQSVLGVDKESWGSKATGGRIRKILGPVMSEFHYYVPTSDPHVTVWFLVRRYSTGATEVETVVENGWLNVAASTAKSYTVTVAVNGSTRYGPAALTHLHHTRWSRVDWVGTDPAISPSHDGGYLRSTKLVPNYTTAYGTPNATTLNLLAQPGSTPFAQGGWPRSMGDAGSGGCILNNWEALYVTSGDYRAYNSTIANARSAGRYGIHYRDETTGGPPIYASYPSHGYDGSGISSCGSVLTTFPTGGTPPPDYAKSHAPPFGYLSYLLTGRHSFREQVEFQAQVSNFATTYTQTFEGVRIARANAGAFTERGWAWAIRSFAAAVVCVPDADIRAPQYRAQLGKTIGYYGANYTDRNNLGIIQGYSSYTETTTDYSNFMHDSVTMACGWAYQTANEQLGSDRARADAFVLWRMKNIVGRMGGQSGYCYRDAARYTTRYANTDLSAASIPTFNSGVFADWQTVYANTVGANTCDVSTSLNGTSGSDPTILSTESYPYWGLVHTALAFAVDLGIAGASAAWARYTAAPNYAPAGFSDLPMWGVVPR